MLRRAELAMFSAKQSPSGYAEYSEHLEKFNPRRLSMMGELRRAISANELELYFQPKVRMSTGRISGAEALARWPQGSTFVSPNEFILLAESTRLIRSLTAWPTGPGISPAPHLAKRRPRGFGCRSPFRARPCATLTMRSCQVLMKPY